MNAAAQIAAQDRHYAIACAERPIGCGSSFKVSEETIAARALYHARREAVESAYAGMTARQRAAAQLIECVGEEAARAMSPHLFD